MINNFYFCVLRLSTKVAIISLTINFLFISVHETLFCNYLIITARKRMQGGIMVFDKENVIV